MATLVLQAAGGVVGGMLGGPLGAALGQAAGALAGSLIDQTWLSSSKTQTGPRLSSVTVQTSAEGLSLPRVYGRVRLAGSVIWATRFEETVSRSRSGSKGSPKIETYSYYGNFAVALCEGPITHVGRIWADGRLLDRSKVTLRIYRGSETQEPDTLIAAKEGAAPAYRGIAYVVFERLPLDDYSNRLPQLSFEVIRAVDRLERQVRAVTLIPGATEFGYATTPVRRTVGEGAATTENVHVSVAATDLAASLDELQALCPALERVALVVSWAGTDLRADHCLIHPVIENRDRATEPLGWSVAGLDRGSAPLVSQLDARPAYGGTPSDASVVEAITELKRRGLKVVLYPFVLMDVPPGNGLPDPYGASEQAAFPWRGRISVAPAPGRAGSPDGTATVTSAVASFMGAAEPEHYSVSGTSVGYSGPTDWHYRRLVLHLAFLAKAAGGVEAILIGSELRGLSTLRGPGGSYPFVDELVRLAEDVNGIAGATDIVTYGADWTEFFGHHPDDGSGDVIFHLDPLWASPAIDRVGIDVYWPLSGWRDGDHLDAAAGYRADTDRSYLAANVAAGEGFDWYYADLAARRAQTRTPIADTAHGEHFVFRYKDLIGWWGSAHHDRPGGVRAATPTDWVAGSKPIWFTELGCPAIDRGANQPNLFVDPKSAESGWPYFSSGARDDAIQRRYLEAMLSHFDPDDTYYPDGANPVSPVDGRRMVEAGAIHLWTWDARPFPAFPFQDDVWSDGDNWQRGHWLTGRLGGTSLAGLVRRVLADAGITGVEVDGLDQTVDGFLIDQPMSARSALTSLAEAFGLSACDTGLHLRLSEVNRPPVMALGRDDLVEEDADTALLSLTRTPDAELPGAVRVSFSDTASDLNPAEVISRRRDRADRSVEDLDLPVFAPRGSMEALAAIRLADHAAGREQIRFTLPPDRLALEAGDAVRLMTDTGPRLALVQEIEDGDGLRKVTARSLVRAAFRAVPAIGTGRTRTRTGDPGAPLVHILDLPPISDTVAAVEPWIGGTCRPWPSGLAVWQSATSEGFSHIRSLDRAMAAGTLTEALPAGPLWTLDRGNSLTVRMSSGTLASLNETAFLAGGNALAVGSAESGWEIVQFRTAELIGSGLYRLSDLLRGQMGTEDVMAGGHVSGAAVVVLDEALIPLPLDRDDLGIAYQYRIGPVRADLSHPATTARTFTAEGRGLRPFAPVHLRVRRAPSSGDLSIRWVRRTRVGGDGWSGEVPLGEEAEAYRLEVRAGGAVLRQIETTTATAVYSAAEQTADFGALPSTLTLAVAQIAAGIGPGIWCERTFDV